MKSKEGTQFRIWATNVLRDHIARGLTANEQRLREMEQRSAGYGDSMHAVTKMMNHILLNMARRDVLHAVVDDVERLKSDLRAIVKKMDGQAKHGPKR